MTRSPVVDAIVFLMETQPRTMVPVILRMLEDPEADQLLAEAKTVNPRFVDAFVNMYNSIEDVRLAFDKLRAERSK